MDLPSPDAISRLLAIFPPFAGEPPAISLAHERREVVMYLAKWPGRDGELRLFTDRGERPLPGRRALDRAAAERAGRLIFGPLGLAPRLLLDDLLVVEPGRSWAVVCESLGDAPFPEGKPTSSQLSSLAGALRHIHASESGDLPLSGAPPTLGAWWSGVLQRYRELPTRLMSALPTGLLSAIQNVLQPVAADVQAHKRFWPADPTATVQGCPDVARVGFRSSGPVFADWFLFGRGDASLDIVRAHSSIELEYGAAPAAEFKRAYSDAGADENFERRLLVYDRVWPFERIVDSLLALWPQTETAAGGLASRGRPAESALRYSLSRLLRTYGPSNEQVTSAESSLDEWISRAAGASGAPC
jgi:hypothetical protein